MPRLLILCEYATLHGGERSMLSTLDGVREAGFEIAVAAPAGGPLVDELERRSVEHVPFRFRDGRGRRLPRDRLRKGLAELVRERRPHLVHANSLSMGRLSGPIVRDAGVPGIAHLRDIIKLSAQAVADLNCHTRLLAVSEAARRFHIAQGVDEGRTFVLHNGVNLGRFRPRTPSGYLHRELGLPDDAQLIATIGQIGLRKGQDTLVQAARIVAEMTPRPHFLIVGLRYSEKAESRRFEADLRAAAVGPLSGRLHFLGYRHDVDRLLGELTLLVHAARQEPLGRVLLESGACGVAIIATAVGGTLEIFPHEINAARLIPPDRPDLLAAAILDLLADDPARRNLAAAARRRIAEAFGATRSCQALIDHYREVRARPMDRA